MTTSSANGPDEDKENNSPNLNAPPPDPVLQEAPVLPLEFATANDVDISKEIRLTLEFPMQKEKKNNVADYFKRFITILFAAEPGITLLNWENPMQNPIQRSMNLQGTKEVISQYFAGMKVHQYRKKIIGQVKITSPVPFWQIKQVPKFWSYISENQIYVRPTILSQNVHANIGWLLHSHPDFTNQRAAIEDLRSRMETRDLEFELAPHTISHQADDETKIVTKALKVRSNLDDRAQVEKELMECLGKGESDEFLTEYSNTARFKLIPFRKGLIPDEMMTDFVKQQNKFLRDIQEISVVNINYLDGSFKGSDSLAYKKKLRDKRIKEQLERKKKTSEGDRMLDSEDEDSEFGDDDENSYVTTSDCEVTSLKSEDEFDIDREESFLHYFAEQRDEGLFISFEKGRKNQMYFLTTKEKKEEAEKWIDGLLDHFLAKYGAKTCIRKFQQNQGEEPPRREKKNQTKFENYEIF